MVISLAPNPTGQKVSKNSTTARPLGAHIALPYFDKEKDIPVLITQAPRGYGAEYIGRGLARNFGFNFVDIRTSLEELLADFRAGLLPQEETPKLKDFEGKERKFDPAKVEERMKQAKLVDDEIVICAIRNKLKKLKKLKDANLINLNGLVFEGIVTPGRARALRKMGPELGIFRNIDRILSILVDPRSAKAVIDVIKNCVKCDGFNIPFLKAFKPSDDGKCNKLINGSRCNGDLVKKEQDKNLSNPTRFRERLLNFIKNAKLIKKEFYNSLNIKGLNEALKPVLESLFSIGKFSDRFDPSKFTTEYLTIKDPEKYIKHMRPPDKVLEQLTGAMVEELDLKKLSPQEIAQNDKAEAKRLDAEAQLRKMAAKEPERVAKASLN